MKRSPGCINVSSGMVTSIGFPGAAISHRVVGMALLVGVVVGDRLGLDAEGDGVELRIPLSVGIGRGRDRVLSMFWVSLASIV